jgi:5'-3' exonuclease/transcription antitermination factor NusG
LGADWVVVELTPKGEKEPPDVLRQSVQRLLGRADVYIPAVETRIGDDTSIHYLINGYAFIRKERPDREYLKLEDTRLFQSVLKDGRGVAVVDSSYIESMKEKARAEINQGIGVGDIVLICSGPYKAIEASVITEIPEERKVQVFIELRSKQSIVTLPRSALKVVDRAPLSLYYARLGYLRAWAKMASVAFSYSSDFRELERKYFDYCFVKQSFRAIQRAFYFVHVYPYGQGPDGLGQLHAKIVASHQSTVRLREWQARGRALYNWINFGSFKAVQGSIRALFARYKVLCDVERRLHLLSQSVEEMARELARGHKGEGDMIVQNVLIDGHNLAFRCLNAPGISRLTDRNGRPSGMVFGFLRSVAALKKRYPEASFWVAWDGSSQRRRSRYPEYKANRKARKGSAVSAGEESFDPLQCLRDLLPSVGLRQVWNSREEADDVIATLVRGELEGQTNLVYSTDRDFLQLVSSSTKLLYPAIGSRREVLFDVTTVEHQFGVLPERVLQLRALFGDKSDNLPGVPRVPKKILKSLVQSHGDVDGVYTSGLSAVNRGQYERLRGAEPQVRINLEVMALVDVEVSRTDPDVDEDGVARRLEDLDIKAASILQAFFGKPESTSESL